MAIKVDTTMTATVEVEGEPYRFVAHHEQYHMSVRYEELDGDGCVLKSSILQFGSTAEMLAVGEALVRLAKSAG